MTLFYCLMFYSGHICKLQQSYPLHMAYIRLWQTQLVLQLCFGDGARYLRWQTITVLLHISSKWQICLESLVKKLFSPSLLQSLTLHIFFLCDLSSLQLTGSDCYKMSAGNIQCMTTRTLCGMWEHIFLQFFLVSCMQFIHYSTEAIYFMLPQPLVSFFILIASISNYLFIKAQFVLWRVNSKLRRKAVINSRDGSGQTQA